MAWPAEAVPTQGTAAPADRREVGSKDNGAESPGAPQGSRFYLNRARLLDMPGQGTRDGVNDERIQVLQR